MSPRPARPRPRTGHDRREARREALERLNALDDPTASQRALRKRLRALEAADPATRREAELRRLLGLGRPSDDQ